MTSLILPKRTLRTVSTVLVILLLNLALPLGVARINGGTSPFKSVLADSNTGRRVGVFIAPETAADQQSALVLENFLRQNTVELADVTLVTGAQATGREHLPEIRSLTDNGVAALNRGDHTEAERLLSSAYGLLQQALGVIDHRTHARILKALGVTRLFTDDKESARDLITRSLLLFEQQSAAEYDYSIDARNLYREVRQVIQDSLPGHMEISTTPGDAAIYVNYQVRGFTSETDPTVLRNLSVGPHFVRIVRDGSEIWADYVTVRPAATTRVDARLSPASEARRFEAARDDALDALRQQSDVSAAFNNLREFVGADEVLVAHARSTVEGFELQGSYMTRDGVVIPVEEVIVQDAALVQTLRAVTSMTIGGEYEDREMLALDSPTGVSRELDGVDFAGSDALFIDPDSPLFAGVGPEVAQPIYKKWWFWTIVGAAVGGAATGIALLSTSQAGSDSGPTGGVSIQLNQF